MTRSITELVGMAKALSEGEVEQQFQQHFQGELGQLASYLEAVRQTLQSLSSTADGSKDLLPQASYGFVEINKEAETGFNSVWETTEKMQSDHAAARRLLGSRSDSGNGPDITELHAILDKNHENLLASMIFSPFKTCSGSDWKRYNATSAKLKKSSSNCRLNSKSKRMKSALNMATVPSSTGARSWIGTWRINGWRVSANLREPK